MMRPCTSFQNESIHAKTQEAKDALIASGIPKKKAHSLALRIEDIDPYKDAGKLFTPIMANWVARGIVMSYDEHLYDIKQYKENRKMLTSKKVTVVNLKKKKELLKCRPEDFKRHYSDLQRWNKECEAIFDDGNGDNSAKEIEIAKHDGYTMYKIDKENHLEIPLVKNKMRWCVTKNNFGGYFGPPYYAIMKDSDSSQFAMIIPNFFNTSPDQAVRDGDNIGRLSPSDMKKVRPLIQMALDPEKHTHPYINAIFDIVVEKPIIQTANEALKYVRDNAIEFREDLIEEIISTESWASLLYAKHLGPGQRFEKGEDAISKSALHSLEYAEHFGPGKRFEKGEDAIAEQAWTSLDYAMHLGPGKRFEKGERAISKDGMCSLRYAKHLGPGTRFEKGERAIAMYSIYSLEYSKHLSPGKRFEKGEDSIVEDAWISLEYAQHLGPGKRFEKGEDEIAKNVYCSLIYARHLGPGKRFEKGEDVIINDSSNLLEYVQHIKSRFKKGESSMSHSDWMKYISFLESIDIEPPDKPWVPGDPE
jgi:hypothetical protein